MYRSGLKKKKQFRIPQGKITYSDLNSPGKALFSKRYQLTGKPDYIINEKGYYIPVELKSGSYNIPQNNHIFQLASYCHLVEETFGGLVPYGRLIYQDSDHIIAFNPKIRFELESILKQMRRSLEKSSIQRNHNDPKKCHSCSMRVYCDISL
ncbi:MAG: CRISPR-associated protein Cas4 [Thermoplasmatota archaeon]